MKEVTGETQNGAADRSSTGAEEDERKKKVIDCCRKLRKAVMTTRFGMKLLEKKMTTRYARVYGNVEEINVKPQNSSSTATTSVGDTTKTRIPLLKIKNFRCADEGTAKRKKDFYAEIRGSPQVPSGSSSTTNQSKVRPKSQCSSLVEESCGVGDNEFFDAFSEMPDENPNVKTEGVDEDPLLTKSLNDDPDMFEGLDLQPLVDEETQEPVKVKKEVEAVNPTKAVPKPRRSVSNSSRTERKPKSTTEPKEDVDENEAARRALLESETDGDTSDSGDEIFQRVKAASSKESAGAPPTLDDPKLKAKCEVLVNRLSKAVRFCFFSCCRIHYFNIFAPFCSLFCFYCSALFFF